VNFFSFCELIINVTVLSVNSCIVLSNKEDILHFSKKYFAKNTTVGFQLELNATNSISLEKPCIFYSKELFNL
jgi:hypothetical protein